MFLRAEASDWQLWWGHSARARAVPCRAAPLSASVPVAVYAAVLPTGDRAHPSASTPQLAARGIPDSTSFHSYLLLLLLFTTPRKQKEWSGYCKYPWRALSVARASSSATPPTCCAAGESCYVSPPRHTAEQSDTGTRSPTGSAALRSVRQHVVFFFFSPPNAALYVRERVRRLVLIRHSRAPTPPPPARSGG